MERRKKETDVTDFSKRLRELREEKGLSQAKLGMKVGFSKTSQKIRMYEIRNNEPKFIELIALAKYFNVSVDYLVGNSDIRKADDGSFFGKVRESVNEEQTKPYHHTLSKIFQTLKKFYELSENEEKNEFCIKSKDGKKHEKAMLDVVLSSALYYFQEAVSCMAQAHMSDKTDSHKVADSLCNALEARTYLDKTIAEYIARHSDGFSEDQKESLKQVVMLLGGNR